MPGQLWWQVGSKLTQAGAGVEDQGTEPMVKRAGSTAPRRLMRRSSWCATSWRILVLALLTPITAMAADFGPYTTAAERRAGYLQLLRDYESAAVGVKLDAVNRFFNAMSYRSDRVTRGQADHWSTPGELLALGAGDCEDLAIGKYFALLSLGIPESALRITYVRDMARNQPHMVLVHRGLTASAAPRVLDSRDNALLSLAQRRDLVPIYDFNEQRVTVVAPDGLRHTFPHTGRWRIRQWDALVNRAASVARATAWTPLLAQAPSHL